MKKSHSLVMPGILAALLLGGCTYTGPEFKRPEFKAPVFNKSAFNGRFQRLKLGGHPSNEFINDYRQTTDGEYTLPAIPVDKIDKKYLRQRVPYVTKEKTGTIIVDVAKRFLYLVEGDGTAIRYGVGVGKQGFEWQGNAYVGWKRAWPTWTPPEEMIERKPELVKYSAENGGMAPGLENPLGARALYLFQDGKDTLYRLHGTPQWASIGTAASSGCIRLMNQDIIDLYRRVPNGTKVVVI